MAKATDKAKSACIQLGKPSDANAKILANLFPSCSSKKRKFDPTEDCVVAEQHRQKKAASKGRSKLLTVVVLNTMPSCIPKGATREHLRKTGRVKEIPFQRYLDEKEVKDLLKANFSDLAPINFQYLQPHKNNGLTVAKDQELDGIGIINLAKSGSLYVKSLVTDASSPVSSSSLPIASVSVSSSVASACSSVALALVSSSFTSASSVNMSTVSMSSPSASSSVPSLAASISSPLVGLPVSISVSSSPSPTSSIIGEEVVCLDSDTNELLQSATEVLEKLNVSIILCLWMTLIIQQIFIAEYDAIVLNVEPTCRNHLGWNNVI